MNPIQRILSLIVICLLCVSTAVAGPIRCFATNPVADPRLVQMALVGPDWGTADQQAAAAIQHFRARGYKPGQIGLYALHVVGAKYDRAQVVRNGGWDNAADKLWWKQLFTLLKAAGYSPDFMFIDEGENLSPWQDDTAKAFPNLDAGKRETYNRAGMVCIAISCQLIREVVQDPHDEVYGASMMIVRYGDWESPVQMLDGNGWPFGFGSVQGRSCVELYNWYGSRHSNGGQLDELTSQWRSALDQIDRLRVAVKPVALAARPSFWGDGKTTPPPKAISGYLWGEKNKHAAASNIDTFVYWNPGSTAADDQAMADFIARASSTAPSRPLPRVSQDATAIATGRVKSTKAAMLKVK